ncbi:Ubiquinol oxidase 1b, mitochondrial [Capsicum baccatum]|uniref:Ubiquinol oxidase n=1 Tax=Capsicum baccatum TaxID=33114 RepID=A0A2G2XQX9_CAPBA|nr:Ubiquinol oxidase 1b, mitochondrial [Capsicum baccatum]
MRIYLQALDIWEDDEDKYEIDPLPNKTMAAQIKTHKERKTRKSKALACLFTAVSSNIFTRIMSLESAKEDAAATFEEKLDGISVLPSDDSENGLPDIPCPNEVSAKHLGEEISSPENDLRKEMSKAANADKLSELELENTSDKQRENGTQSDELSLPSNSQLAQVESCQILCNNSVGDSGLTQFGDPCCKTSAALQEIQKTTGSSSTEEKLKVGGMSTSESHLSGKKKAYGEVTTKRLCEYFKENNYPNCDAKEKFEQSGGWIKGLPEEAENERMHLMTMVEIV